MDQVDARFHFQAKWTFDVSSGNVVTVNDETITLADSGTTEGAYETLLEGDPVQYFGGGDTAIGGLTDYRTYYVMKVGSFKIKLSENRSPLLAVDLTDVGEGDAHTLTPLGPRNYVYKSERTIVVRLSALSQNTLTFGTSLV